MKKLLLIPIALFVAITSSQAQDVKKETRNPKQRIEQKTPEQRAEMMTKRMTEKLSLTKEQQDQVYQLSLKQAKVNVDRAKISKEKTTLMREENQKNRQEIEKILSPEQQKKWTEEMNSRKKGMDRTFRKEKDSKQNKGSLKSKDTTRTKKAVN